MGGGVQILPPSFDGDMMMCVQSEAAFLETPKNVVVWFRKSLRLHDNAALTAAIEQASARGASVIPVFCLDPHFVESGAVGPVRWRFLLQSLADLHAQLQRHNSGLFVLRAPPSEAVPRACRRFGADEVHFETDTESFAKARDAAVAGRAAELGVRVLGYSGHTLYDLERLLEACAHQPPKTYKGFLALHNALGPPDRPRDAPLDALATLPPAPWAPRYAVPALRDVLPGGAAPQLDPPVFPGGETAGLRRLVEYCRDERRVATFAKPDGDPTTIAPCTTGLSPYLKFGCVSARRFYWDVQAVYDRHKGHTQPPQSLHGQLLFREWFYLHAHATPNWDRMEGNPLCRQIPWDRDADKIAAWREGRTGFPWIDAAMRQLARTGWMHHLARHAVACFLTRGDLWQHWEEGARVFDYYLVDADWAVNHANWYWLSASAFFSQYFRVYSPVSFARKYDKDGAFVRHYVPELKDMPAKFIYEPWKAPLEVLPCWTAPQGDKCVLVQNRRPPTAVGYPPTAIWSPPTAGGCRFSAVHCVPE